MVRNKQYNILDTDLAMESMTINCNEVSPKEDAHQRDKRTYMGIEII